MLKKCYSLLENDICSEGISVKINQFLQDDFNCENAVIFKDMYQS